MQGEGSKDGTSTEKDSVADTKGEGEAEAVADSKSAKMPPPASVAATTDDKKVAGSDAIEAAVKAGNINIHQEERECVVRVCLPKATAVCSSCGLRKYLITPSCWTSNGKGACGAADLAIWRLHLLREEHRSSKGS